eukprot:9483311-Pyramimonas_sp.AAC.2
MRFILTKAGLDSVRLNLFKGVCDTCRERSAWGEPGHAVMPSTALPGNISVKKSNGTIYLTNRNNISQR